MIADVRSAVQEFVGTLRGFDDYVNMVLEDVTEYEINPDGGYRYVCLLHARDIAHSRNHTHGVA